MIAKVTPIINKNRKILPNNTQKEKVDNLILKTPATRQIGSPTMGSQEKNKIGEPYLLNFSSNCFFLLGFIFIYLEKRK